MIQCLDKSTFRTKTKEYMSKIGAMIERKASSGAN